MNIVTLQKKSRQNYMNVLRSFIKTKRIKPKNKRIKKTMKQRNRIIESGL